MVKRHAASIAVIGVIGFICSLFFAECGMCQIDKAKAEKVTTGAMSAVKVNNTICPVSGNPVDMNNPVTVEYNGKIYNMCCPACVAPFKADPEKYIKKIADQQAEKK